MGNKPLFAAVPVIGHATIDTANALRDGSGAVEQVAVGIAGGTRIEYVEIVPRGTTTEGTVRLFLALTDGGNKLLLREVHIDGNVLSATNPAVNVTVEFPKGLSLPEDASLWASTERGERFEVFAFGGNYADAVEA